MARIPPGCQNYNRTLRLGNERSCGTWNPDRVQKLNAASQVLNGEVELLKMFTVRTLVVDDYEPFRQFVCSTLGKRRDVQVIGEASDGLEAVRKAEELKPDLVVLDIGLPTLNGIEVGRRIRKLCPECKILFMSQVSTADVAQEVFSVGALGYIVKAHAASELLAAVEAVCQGRQFVSKGLSGHNWTSAPGAQAPDKLLQPEVQPPLVSKRANVTHCHELQSYSDDAAFLLGVTCFIEAALKDGKPVIVVATESHRTSLLERLLARGVDGAAAVEEGLYLTLDVDEVLSTFMVNDLPDSIRYLNVMHDLVSSAAKAAKAKHARVAVFGEIAPTLWARGKADAAIQVEQVTDEFAKTRKVDILCGYVLNSFQSEQQSDAYQRICAAHTTICSQ
jgi:DNA-binding NarL/FixJ family response regulator